MTQNASISKFLCKGKSAQQLFAGAAVIVVPFYCCDENISTEFPDVRHDGG